MDLNGKIYLPNIFNIKNVILEFNCVLRHTPKPIKHFIRNT